MKTKLLFILLLASFMGNAQFYLNEIMVDPPGDDNPNEYIEIRGTANTALTNMYIVVVEGDGNDPGDVNEVIDLTSQTIGSNGYLVLLTTGHPYTVDSGANIALDLTDGELESQSHTFFLVQTTTPPSTSDDIDTVGGAGDIGDGTPDGTPYTDWTIFDSISLLKDNDGSGEAYAYSNIGFLEDDTSQANPTLFAPAGANIIVTTGAQFDYVARIGNSTGSALTNDETTSDWVGGDLPSGNLPNWTISTTSNRAYPTSFEGSELNHIGSANPSQNTTLSTTDISASNFKISPNPANKFVNIESKNIKVSSVDIYNLLGSKVKSVSQLNDNKVNVESLSRGMYLLKINAEAKSITKKIIIE
ncbi:T9SS type A sorting domain-containing protein [Flavivirga aquimarina]|uniref:T9SS type A sorting domain-containing protein n=1 Tax=Flavivirga aquimarina TaxID=2027862 RepID=A0ABT8WB31_9FLAO|nr:T9SS type A sorting domain-containing protein [Flavivirga aquimarina]MDO5970338.1 T9SS type A sorting domain-containing protein [Flavivirga aquimarina]